MKNVRAYLNLALNIIFCLSVIFIIAIYPPPQTVNSLIPVDETRVRQAEWETQDCLGVQCELCPFRCFLPEGARGICRVRMNVAGRLKTLVYASQ